MKVVIAGGGTGGHLFPGLAVARALQELDQGCETLFVGSKRGIEARIIPRTEFNVRFITVRGLKRTGIKNAIKGLMEIPLSIAQSILLLMQFKPNVVLGVGGYASAPVVLASYILRIPRAIQEQNSVMGSANRLLSNIANRIFISWEGTEPETDPEKTIITGNPIRADLLEKSANRDYKNRDRFNILIFGGSAGAASLNKAMIRGAQKLAKFGERINITHQTGKVMAKEVQDAYKLANIQAETMEFIDSMGAAYDWADLVICRGGAGAMAEISAKGKPAIVVPYPYAVGDHQTKNARLLARRRAVRIIPDESLDGSHLVDQIIDLLEHPAVLADMAENSLKLGRPEAAGTIARELVKLGGSCN